MSARHGRRPALASLARRLRVDYKPSDARRNGGPAAVLAWGEVIVDHGGRRRRPSRGEP